MSSAKNIETAKIMRKDIINENKIGTCKLWNQSCDLTKVQLQSMSVIIQYILFLSDRWKAKIIQQLYFDMRDLEEFNCSYNKGKHSSWLFAK